MKMNGKNGKNRKRLLPRDRRTRRRIGGLVVLCKDKNGGDKNKKRRKDMNRKVLFFNDWKDKKRLMRSFIWHPIYGCNSI